MSARAFDQVFDRLAHVEGFLATSIRSVEQVGAHDLAEELREMLLAVKDLGNRLVDLERARKDERWAISELGYTVLTRPQAGSSATSRGGERR